MENLITITFTNTEGQEEKLTLFNSMKAFVVFEQEFGISLFDAFEKFESETTSDPLIGLKIAFAMAKPSLVGKISFEDFCEKFDIPTFKDITKKTLAFITKRITSNNEEIEEAKNS